MVAAQTYHVLAWSFVPGPCDFPEDCLGGAYAGAFTAARVMAGLSALATGLALTFVVATGSSWRAIARLALAVASVIIGHRVAPLSRISDPAGWTSVHRPLEEGLGSAWPALSLFALAVAPLSCELVRRARANRASHDPSVLALAHDPI